MLLTKLQQLDDLLRALAGEQEQLARQLQGPENAYRDAQQQLTQMQADIDQSEHQQRTLDREVDRSQDVLTKVEAKLREVKTNKEYSAVLAEIATAKESIAAAEDQLLQLMEAADQQRQLRQRLERDVQTTEQELQRCRQVVQREHESLAQRMATEGEKRQQLFVGIETRITATYEKLAAHRGGRAVAHLRDGVCDGCHLKIQPQLISEIRLQETLFTCPHCRLILLWPIEPEVEKLP